MRLAAYKKAMQEASILQTHIPELKKYFKNNYSPRDTAMWEILSIARKDCDELFPSEFIDFYEEYKKIAHSGEPTQNWTKYGMNVWIRTNRGVTTTIN